jgi:hypothetical protein
MDKPAEILLFDYLAECQNAAAVDDVIYPLDLHDTIYQAIKDKKPNGIRISDAVGDLAPEPGGGLKEYDVSVQIVCYAKVTGTDKKQRQDALITVFAIQRAVCQLLIDDQSLGNRVCDVLIKKSYRSYDVFDGGPYAVANIPVVINPSGEQ